MGRRSINGHSRRRSNKRSAIKKTVETPNMQTQGSVLTDISSPMKNVEIASGPALAAYRAFNRKRKAKWYNAGSMQDSQGYEAQDQELSSLASTGQYIPPDSAI